MTSPVPAKSHHQQQLPNFSFIKWKKSRSNNIQRRTKFSSDSSPPPRVHSPRPYSPIRDWAPRFSPMPDSVPDSGHVAPTQMKIQSENPKNEAYASYSAVKIVENSEKKLNIRFKVNLTKHEEEEEETGVEELVPKTWNLRPRKPISLNVNGALKVGGSAVQESKTQLLLPQGSNTDRLDSQGINGSEKKEKKLKKFSIPLSREEIEEDVFALTGSKPARRPKKRPRIVQKTLDNIFPGMWLASVTPDSYKVSENPIKG